MSNYPILQDTKAVFPTKPLSDCLVNVKVPTKVPRSSFLSEGNYPIISQESDFINGYWNNTEDAVQVDGPVVVFGDHTQVLKLIDFDFVVGADGVKILKPKYFLDAGFLRYFLEANPIESLGYARHYRHISGIPIALPPMEEQKRIVAILDQAFVALDRACALAEANLADAKQVFPSTIAQAFSPKSSWQLYSVASLVKEGVLERPIDGNHGETHPKKADFVESGVPFIMASDLVDGHVDQSGCYFLAREQADGLRKGFAKNGDVLISHKGTIGRAAILTTALDYVMLTPQVTYYRVTDHDRLDQRFLYYCMRSSAFQDQMTEIANGGATRAYIGITRQLELELPLPDLEMQRRLVEQFEDTESRVHAVEKHYERCLIDIANLRQSLLQKAFSGQLT